MAGNQLTEQEIQFRKRARRRLVGAVALVLLMVTVLPMVLDDQEAKGPQPDIAISIPSQDANDFASKIVPVAPATSAPGQTIPVNPQASGEPPKAPPPVAVTSKPAAPQVELATPLQKPSEPQNKPASSSVEEKPAPAVHPSPKPESKPEPAATKPAGNKGAFSVQIGVFSDADKVKKLQDKLLAQGVRTYTEKLATPNGSKIRLRSGPYATRPDAEAVRDKLKAANVAAMVVVNK